MPVRSRRRNLAGAVLALAAVAAASTGCGDGRPAFCDDLARAADMDALSAALRAQDLDRARTAAREFSDLADGAPEDLRPDMLDLARAVSEKAEAWRAVATSSHSAANRPSSWPRQV